MVKFRCGATNIILPGHGIHTINDILTQKKLSSHVRAVKCFIRLYTSLVISIETTKIHVPQGNINSSSAIVVYLNTHHTKKFIESLPPVPYESGVTTFIYIPPTFEFTTLSFCDLNNKGVKVLGSRVHRRKGGKISEA